MPVLMTLRMQGDASALERIAAEDPGRMQAISQDGKARGAISHRFYANDAGEVMVVDEWESPEAFQAFFAAHPEIQQLMADAGVTSEPTITFWRQMDTNDQF